MPDIPELGRWRHCQLFRGLQNSLSCMELYLKEGQTSTIQQQLKILHEVRSLVQNQKTHMSQSAMERMTVEVSSATVRLHTAEKSKDREKAQKIVSKGKTFVQAE